LWLATCLRGPLVMGTKEAQTKGEGGSNTQSISLSLDLRAMVYLFLFLMLRHPFRPHPSSDAPPPPSPSPTCVEAVKAVAFCGHEGVQIQSGNEGGGQEEETGLPAGSPPNGRGVHGDPSGGGLHRAHAGTLLAASADPRRGTGTRAAWQRWRRVKSAAGGLVMAMGHRIHGGCASRRRRASDPAVGAQIRRGGPMASSTAAARGHVCRWPRRQHLVKDGPGDGGT
jgi:hypothetical protein